MRTMFLAVTLAVVSIVWWPADVAIAQEQQVARGTVSDMSGASITIQVRGEPMSFAVDASTHVEARGAGTTSRKLAAAGKSGPNLADILTIGQPVAITYRAAPGSMPRASLVRAVPSVSNGGSVTTAELRSIGTVKALGPDSITIVGGSGGGASFEQTFHIGADTKVVGKGVGTAAAAKGGKAPFSELISTGDRVSVSYRKAGGALHASDVRVTVKGSGSH
jgi:hypothetical protein